MGYPQCSVVIGFGNARQFAYRRAEPRSTRTLFRRRAGAPVLGAGPDPLARAAGALARTTIEPVRPPLPMRLRLCRADYFRALDANRSRVFPRCPQARR